MHEDSGVDVLTIVATAIVVFAALSSGLRRGEDDQNWELRWHSLDPGTRDWLAAMTTSYRWMKTLTDPEEIQLARGFSSRELRRYAYFDLAASALLVFALALVLAGVLPPSTSALVIAVWGTVRWISEWGRKQQIRRRLRQRSDSEAAPPRPAAAPAWEAT